MTVRRRTAEPHARDQRQRLALFGERCRINARVAVIAYLALALALPIITNGFQVTMNYKPPLKSSVKKLYEQRFPSRRRTSHTTKSAFSSGLAFPSPPSFQDRMRKLVLDDMETKKETRRRQANLPDNLFQVYSLEDYKLVVGDEREQIVAVRFYATYCKACRAVEPHFYKLARDHPTVKFVDVPVTDSNAVLHRGLQVPSLPFGHVYHPQAGLVEELRLTRPLVPQFRKALESYVQGSCELEEAEDS